MEHKHLINYLNNPASLDQDSLNTIENLTTEYPYFQIARMLYLKNLKNINSTDFSPEKYQEIAYVSDRNKLFHLLEDDFSIYDKIRRIVEEKAKKQAEEQKYIETKTAKEKERKEAEQKRLEAKKAAKEKAKKVEEQKRLEAEKVKKATEEKAKKAKEQKRLEAEKAKKVAEEKAKKAEEQKRLEAEKAKKVAEEKAKKAEEQRRLGAEKAKKVAEEKAKKAEEQTQIVKPNSLVEEIKFAIKQSKTETQTRKKRKIISEKSEVEWNTEVLSDEEIFPVSNLCKEIRIILGEEIEKPENEIEDNKEEAIELLSEEFDFTEDIFSDANEIILEEEKDNTSENIYRRLSEQKEETTDEFMLLDEENTSSIETKQENNIHNSQETQEEEFDFSEESFDFELDNAKLIKKSPEDIQPEKRKEREEELISRFIEHSPRIKPLLDANQEEVDFSENQHYTETLVSEKLAIIYTEQQHFDKAIEVYSKLSLKYPEKSTFFAARVREIEKLKNEEL